VAPPSAEFVIGAVGGIAVGAHHFGLGTAFHAALYAHWALELALPAFHGFPRRIVERG